MANIKQAFEYAAQNPDSEFATNLKQLAASGSLNQEAEKYGIDLSAFQPKKSVYENTVDKLSQRGANIVEEVTRPTATPEMGTKAVRAIGQVGAGVGDIIGGGIEAVFKGADRLTGGGASETISEEGNALLNTDLGKQAVSALQMGMDKYAEWRQNNLDFAKNLEAVVNIASAVPVVKGAGALGKTAVEVGESAVAGAKTIPGQIKPITEGLMKKIGTPELSPVRAVGQIAQGATEDIAPVAKALSIIDTKGVKTFDDLLGKTNSAIPTLAKQVDEELLKDAGVYSLDNLALSQTTKAGKVIKTDYVGRALDNLSELYKTTGDDVAKAEIDDVISKATTQGLSRKEVNDISRLYGQEFGRKAFSKIGDPLTSVNAQAFENVRTGLKQVARNGIGGAEAKAIDEQLSALYDTQRLVEKNVEAVNKLKQRIQDRGILESITHTAFKALDTLSAGSIRGVIGGLLPRGAGYKTMNALDIEDALRGNLDIVEKALKSNSDEELAKILNKGFNQKSDLPSSSLIKNTTNKTNTAAKNVTMTETIPQKVKGASGKLISDEAVAKAREVLNKAGKPTEYRTLGITTEELRAAATIGARYIEDGVRTAVELGERLAKEGYKLTKAQVEKIFVQSQTLQKGARLDMNKIDEAKSFVDMFSEGKFSSPEMARDAKKFITDNGLDYKKTLTDKETFDVLDSVVNLRQDLRKTTFEKSANPVSKELQPLAEEARKYKTTVNIQDKNDLEYLGRILSKDQIADIKAGKMTNFRGTSYEDLSKVNIISETPKTIEQQLSGKIKPVKLKSDTFYHGTSAENADGIMKSGFKVGSKLPEGTFRGGGYGNMQNSISFAETPKEASIFSTLTRDGKIIGAKLKPDAKVVSIEGVEDAVDLEDYIDYLKSQKIDAVYIGGGEKELVVINPKAIKANKGK